MIAVTCFIRFDRVGDDLQGMALSFDATGHLRTWLAADASLDHVRPAQLRDRRSLWRSALCRLCRFTRLLFSSPMTRFHLYLAVCASPGIAVKVA
jgi:hypothetical protein